MSNIPRLSREASDLYPVTIVADRYRGSYSRGKYLAFQLDPEHIPEAVGAGDTEEDMFWNFDNKNGEIPVGRGDTPTAALEDLAAVLKGAP